MKLWIHSRMLALLLAVLGSAVCAAQVDTALMRQATMVFKGEILIPNSSTIDHENPSDLSVVRVLEVLEGEDMLGPYLGKEITVKFPRPSLMRKGLRAVFYADMWISGDGLAVTAIGMEAGGIDDKDLRKKILNSRATLQEDSLVQDIRKAELVVSGQIVSLKRLPMTNQKESEHDPEWTIAELKVDDGMKGAQAGPVRFVFAASNDVMWFRAPKFRESQRGIWLLSRAQPGFDETKIFPVVHPRQYLDIQQKDRVRRLVNRTK